MNVLDLVREDLRDFAGYESARRASASGSVWLNANESPWRSAADDDSVVQGVNRYPEPQPRALRDALAQLYGVRAEQLLIGRGSDEAIDLLVRALCRPQRDAVVVTPPVFGMYAVSARLQNAPLVEVPLIDEGAAFRIDLAAIEQAAFVSRARVVFLCSPSNPTGQAIDPQRILELAEALRYRALVVVDEAYVEYADVESLSAQAGAIENLAVLRTLSKAHALAAARIGSLIAAPQLISVLRNCQAPYPLPTPCVRLALRALETAALAQTHVRIAAVRQQRERVIDALRALPAVRSVYASQGNYVLARFDDAQRAFDALLAAGVVVRDMRTAPQLGDALRISIGSMQENDAMLAALDAATVRGTAA